MGKLVFVWSIVKPPFCAVTVWYQIIIHNGYLAAIYLEENFEISIWHKIRELYQGNSEDFHNLLK